MWTMSSKRWPNIWSINSMWKEKNVNFLHLWLQDTVEFKPLGVPHSTVYWDISFPYFSETSTHSRVDLMKLTSLEKQKQKTPHQHLQQVAPRNKDSFPSEISAWHQTVRCCPTRPSTHSTSFHASPMSHISWNYPNTAIFHSYSMHLI